MRCAARAVGKQDQIGAPSGRPGGNRLGRVVGRKDFDFGLRIGRGNRLGDRAPRKGQRLGDKRGRQGVVGDMDDAQPRTGVGGKGEAAGDGRFPTGREIDRDKKPESGHAPPHGR